METKDLILLMLMPIILVGIIAYTNTNLFFSASITGAATAQKESNVIGTYSIMPSFRAKIDYDLNDYSRVKELLDFILKCMEDEDADSCIKQAESKDESFEWALGCDKGAERVLYDFAEFYQDCFDSEDINCLCRKNLGLTNDEMQKYGLANQIYRMELSQDENSRKIKMEMSEPAKLSYSIDTGNSIAVWYPNSFTLAYTHNQVVMIFKNIIEGTEHYYSFPIGKKEVVLYKNNIGNIESADFVKEEDDGLFYPNDQKAASNKIPDCQPKPKNILRLCATKKGSNVIAYDNADGKVKEMPVTIKLASYAPKSPQQVKGIEVLDNPMAEKSLLIRWQSDDAASYKIYYAETSKDILEKTPIVDLNKNPDVKIMELSIGNAETVNFDDVVLTQCKFDYEGRNCVFSNSNKDMQPISSNKLYYFKKSRNYVYSIDVEQDSKDYDFAVSAVVDGRELGNVKENQKLAVIKGKKSVDDMPPDKITALDGTGTPDGKVRLKWKKPSINIDKTTNYDLAGFNIYYKNSMQIIPSVLKEESQELDSYKMKSVSAADAGCDTIRLDCEYAISGLEKGQFYNFAVTAFDKSYNEFTENPHIIKVPVPVS